MSRILAFSDIHGHCRKIKEALKKAKYNPDNDILVGCGDYIDRGTESRECIKLMQGLEKNGAVILKGNHEEMLVDHIKNPHLSPYYLYPNNGGLKTLYSYACAPMTFTQELRKDVEWMDGLPLTYTIPKENLLFVHAGLNLDKTLADQNEADLTWIYEPWVFSKRPHNFNYKVVFGHAMTPYWVPRFLQNDTKRLIEWQNNWDKKNGGMVFKEDDRICIDTATGAGFSATVYDVSNDIQYRGI